MQIIMIRHTDKIHMQGLTEVKSRPIFLKKVLFQNLSLHDRLTCRHTKSYRIFYDTNAFYSVFNSSLYFNKIMCKNQKD